MAPKLKKVFGAVKDQTSITLALVALRGSSTELEVAILKATSHDEVPVNDRYATEVLLLASSSPGVASSAATALRRRMTKTSNWVVALKTLTVIYTTMLDGGPNFRREAAMHRLLDLSSFRSSPWDFTAFVRTYARYLDARLQASLQGYISLRRRRRRCPTDLKPGILLDRIQHWQQLLDRAVGTRPTGLAKTNRLVQISLCSIIRESFDLYDDVAGGISLLLDNFFQLPYPSCVATVEACRNTAKLFEDLDEFYVLCKNMGICSSSEYPTVRKISNKLLQRLNDFLRDHKGATPPPSNTESPQRLLLGSPPESVLDLILSRREKEPESERVSRKPSSCRGSINPFIIEDDERRCLSFRSSRASSARDEARGSARNSFEKSAWIQNKLDGDARQKLIQEQEQWVKHQNRIMESNLAFL